MPKPLVPDVILLRLPSRLELLSVVDRVNTEACERMEFDEDTTSQMSMSVIEAATNAVQHGHGRDPSKLFDVRFILHPDRLEVVVRDEGHGFDPGRVTSDITSPDHVLDLRGRGLFIMRSCCDQVDFSFGEGGTTCRLVKHRPTTTSRAVDA